MIFLKYQLTFLLWVSETEAYKTLWHQVFCNRGKKTYSVSDIWGMEVKG